MKPERLTRADTADAVAALCAAFVDYPVMRYVLADAGGHYEEHLAALLRLFCLKRLLRDWPVLGVRAGAQLAGVALISEPGTLPAPPSVEALREEVAETIGAAAWARLEHYEAESDLDAPEEPHYFLGVIGVRPEHQGSGWARSLLEEVARMSEGNPRSTGVCLNTESRRNVSFYEHMGYRTLAHRTIDTLETWCLFRPDA